MHSIYTEFWKLVNNILGIRSDPNGRANVLNLGEQHWAIKLATVQNMAPKKYGQH